MKRVLYIIGCIVVALSMGACHSDPIENSSVIDSPTTEKNSFDLWLDQNFVYPYQH